MTNVMSAGMLFVLFLLILLTFCLGFTITRNLTPHAIVISVAGTVEIIQPSGMVDQCREICFLWGV